MSHPIHLRKLILAVGMTVPSLCIVVPNQAQTASTGAIIGAVTDQTGAVLQDAEIDITSEATGAGRTVKTEAGGVYRVPLLPPGRYRLKAMKDGFKLAIRSDVPVVVTETTTLDIALLVGSNSETVEVDSNPQMLQTDSSALGHVTDERSVTGLPLASRNFTQIIGLSPGASVGLTDATQLGTGNGGQAAWSNEGLSVNGARNYDNDFQIDGVTANDQFSKGFQSGGIAIPNPDAITEFKVQTGQYDASYGRNAGANVDVVTKSGTNEFHGNLFEFFRNEDLNANEYFFNADGLPRGLLRQNQFGGTIGGPVLKDKLLFFGSYQGTRQTNGVTSGCSATFTGPPLTDDRSAPALGAIFGGQSGAEGGVAVAPDGSNINPVALTLLNQKLPNGGYVAPSPRTVVNGEGQYAFSIPCTYSENQFLTNFDWLQSARSRFGVKYFFSDSTILQSLIWSNVPGSPVNGTQNYRNIAATHDFIFSSTMLNQVQFGYHSIVRGFPSPSAFTFPGIGASVDPPSENFAYIELPQENIGAFENGFITNKAYTLQDTFTYNRGRHDFRFGGGSTRTHVPFDIFVSSTLQFLSFPDLLLGQSAAQNGSGYSNIYASSYFTGSLGRDYLQWDSWLYAQDNYKITPRLTFNLGLRYEHPGYLGDQDGKEVGFSFANADPNPPASGSQAGYVLPANYHGEVPEGSIRVKNDWGMYGNGQNTFSPRVGFAWQVLPKSSRLVLRGGYGIYYSTEVGEAVWQENGNPPWVISQAPSGTGNAAATFATPFALPYVTALPQFLSYSPTTQLSSIGDTPALNNRPPITQQYSLNVQTQLSDNYLLEVGYVGSRGTHQVHGILADQGRWATPQNPIRGETTNTLANLPLRLPIQGFAPASTYQLETSGSSWYDSLQTSLTKRFGHGLQFLASYTYARLFDTEAGISGYVGIGADPPGNQDDPKARYGPASSIRPHRLTVSFVYELPKPVPDKFAGYLLKNWTVSGVSTVQSGHPLTITSTNANNVFGINAYGGDLGEWAPGCNRWKLETPGAVSKKLNNYFNQSCVAPYPIVGDDGIATGFGNMGVGLVNGPGQLNFDLAVSRQFPANWFGRESAWLFRTEFFNAFNTPNFQDPDLNISDGAAFGVINSTLGNPRVIQFALKYNF